MLGFKKRVGRQSLARQDLVGSIDSCSIQELVELRVYGTNLCLKSFNRILAQRPGHHRSRFFGRGTDYESSRAYMIQDDVRTIDWRMSARRDELFVKIHREERERPLLVLLDQSVSMQFASQGAFKSVRATQCALLVAWAACTQNERIGLWCLRAHELTESLPQAGEEALSRIINQVCFSAPDTIVFEQDTDGALEAALHRLQQRAAFGSLIMVFSDFYTLSDTSAQRLLSMARHSDVVLVYFYDELEQNAPAQQHSYFSNGKDFLAVDAQSKANQNRYRQVWQQKMDQLQFLNRQPGIITLTVRTDEAPEQVFAQKLMLAVHSHSMESCPPMNHFG